MDFSFRLVLVSVLLFPIMVSPRGDAAEGPSPEQIEFFEKQVRPLLIEHCSECHGSKKTEAGLRLDTKRGFSKGSETGPVVMAGNVDGSKFMRVLQYLPNETQMPPKGKLSDEKIAVVRKWLELGNPWPNEAASADETKSPKDHWSFQPIKRPTIPRVESASKSGDTTPPSGTLESVPITPIDSFIIAAQKEKGLALSSSASRLTFLRRATFDLWGIPPTYDQIREFEEDASPDAHERLIDRLLASPLYGQRWARHWLDVARYADTKGYVFTQEPRYAYSYTYRDYVVDAFNADKPYDEFVIEQLAADMLVSNDPTPPGDSQATSAHRLTPNDPRLAAMGFLTVGRRYLNNTHDIIDDRIDVVSRGMLGLTVTCARCHDHKFDPVPTADYYSLYGVFASTNEPEDMPIIGQPTQAAAYEAFQAELAKREKEVADFEQQSFEAVRNELRTRGGDCLLAIARENNNLLKVGILFDMKTEPRKQLVERWKRFLERTAMTPHRVMAPWHLLAKASMEEFVPSVTKLVDSWKAGDNNAETEKINPLVRQAIIDKPPQNMADLSRIYGSLFQQTVKQWDDHLKTTPDAKSLPESPAEELRQVLYGEGAPATITMDESRGLFGRDVRDKITKKKRDVDNLKVTSPGAPPRAMVLRDGRPHEAVVFIRGNPGRHGPRVPRQFLEIVAGESRKPFSQGSGRLELARAIVDPSNPLTPRVLVNRVWQHHFGTGIVPTTSDFGTRGLPPSHPALLDWLSAEMAGIVGQGPLGTEPKSGDDTSTKTSSAPPWSLKRLHRLIMASASFRQSSEEDKESRRLDPENRLLWRMPRQRLDFESMRDSLLAVSESLDPSLGGRPFEDQMDLRVTRRTIYGLVNRNDLPGVFRSFDFADVDASTGERPSTTVPQQALFALNSPFVLQRARQVATLIGGEAGDDAQRLTSLYRRVLGRDPSSEERELGLRYLSEALTTPTEKQTTWERLAQVMLVGNEFWFVD